MSTTPHLLRRAATIAAISERLYTRNREVKVTVSVVGVVRGDGDAECCYSTAATIAEVKLPADDAGDTVLGVNVVDVVVVRTGAQQGQLTPGHTESDRR